MKHHQTITVTQPLFPYTSNGYFKNYVLNIYKYQMNLTLKCRREEEDLSLIQQVLEEDLKNETTLNPQKIGNYL